MLKQLCKDFRLHLDSLWIMVLSILGGLAGGMVLGQIASLTGLEPHTVQNWVKRGFLSNPVNKRYSCNQFCRIVCCYRSDDDFSHIFPLSLYFYTSKIESRLRS